MLEEHKPPRLQREEGVERVEALLVQCQVRLERLEPQGDVAHLRLERPDLRGVLGDLVAERPLLPLVLGQTCLDGRELRVDLVLLRDVVAQRRRRNEEQNDECERQPPHSGRFAAGTAYSCGRLGGVPSSGGGYGSGTGAGIGGVPSSGGGAGSDGRSGISNSFIAAP